jgi:hypothetical protein
MSTIITAAIVAALVSYITTPLRLRQIMVMLQRQAMAQRFAAAKAQADIKTGRSRASTKRTRGNS